MSASEIPAVIRKAVIALRQEEAAFVAEVKRYSSDPRPGSPFVTDRDEAWKPAHHKHRTARRRLWATMFRHAQLMQENVLDHVRATRRILDPEPAALPPLFAHMTAMRVACEAAAQIAHLFDPSTTYEQRLLRGAVLLRDDAAHRATAARTVPATVAPYVQPGINAALGQPAKVAAQIAKAGIAEVPGRNPRKKTAWLAIPNGPQEPVAVQMADLMKRAFADRPGLYNYGSGVAHSMRWMLGDAVARRNGAQVDLAPDIIGIGSATLACLDACGVVSRTFAGYFGHDPAPAEGTRDTRLQAVTVWMKEHGVPTAERR